MAGADEGWNLVQRRRKLKRYKADVWCDERWKKLSGGEGGEISYFFTKFPDNFGVKEMHRAFANYGRILEVVIPAKRDRFGQRFGFARFIGVADPNLFGTMLDNIIIGATKINVNAPRFARTNNGDAGAVEQIQRRATAGKHTVNTRANDSQRFVWREKKKEDLNAAQKKTYVGAVKENLTMKMTAEGGRASSTEAGKHEGDNKHDQPGAAKPKWRRRRRGNRPRRDEFKGLLCYDVEEE